MGKPVPRRGRVRLLAAGTVLAAIAAPLANASTPDVTPARETVRAAAAKSAAAGVSSTRYLVGYKAGAGGAVANLVLGLGGRILSTIGALNVDVVDLSDAVDGAVETLRLSPLVTYVEGDGELQATDTTPNDPYFPTGSGSLFGGEWGSFTTQAPRPGTSPPARRP